MVITGINHNCPSVNSGSDRFKDSKCSCKVMKHNIKEISSGSTNHNDLFFFFGDFCRRSIKPWKRWANFVKFRCLPILAIDCNKQWEKVQCLNIIIIYNSLSPLTEVSSVPGYCGSSGVSSVVGSALWSNIQSTLVHLKEKKYSFSALL